MSRRRVDPAYALPIALALALLIAFGLLDVAGREARRIEDARYRAVMEVQR